MVDDTSAGDRTIGRYQILDELGRGGMGVVYRARDPVIDRVVALKTIRNAEGMAARQYEELRDRFLNEARAAGRLRHPNIVAILDAGTDDASGVSYIAMEFVRGRDLDVEIATGRRFTPQEAADIVAAAAAALGYAHDNGVVHRDVKPANILLDEDGGIKLTDFGIARLAESSMTRTGQILGSPSYMSPEQIAGSPVDARSDVFSLGVVLYQLMTGEKPFLGEGLSTLSFQIVNTEPVPARKANPAISAAHEAVIERAMCKSPDERFASAAELVQALRGGASAATNATDGTIVNAGAPSGMQTVDLRPAPPTGTIVAAAPAAMPAASGRAGGRNRPAARKRSLIPIVAVVGAVAAGGLLFAKLRGGGDETAGEATTVDSGANATLVDTAATTSKSDPATIRLPPAQGDEPPQPNPSVGDAVDGTADDDEPAFDAEPATVLIDFEHHIERGVVTLSLDDEEVWRQSLSARKKRRFGVPGLNLAHGEINEQLELPAGEYMLAVRVDSQKSDIHDTEVIRAILQPGRASLLKIRVDRLTKSVSVEHQ